MATVAVIQPVTRGARFGGDRRWLIAMTAVTGLEFAWWGVLWIIGLAPLPFVCTYLGFAFAGLTCVLLGRVFTGTLAQHPNWWTLIPATMLIGIGASLFLPIKYAIPHIVPFWLDPPLAGAERAIFGGDPWLQLDRLLGWAAVPVDRLYALWLPIQSLVLFTVVTLQPSAAKSRALTAYVFAWFLLGVVAAIVFSSAGPLFYDRVFGGTSFEPLGHTLRNRGAWMAIAESDKMWTSLATGNPGIVAGISAVPSIHVAISVWIFLVARTMAPRLAPFALVYALAVWLGSVQLGWHFVVDGLAGALGMLAIWIMTLKLLACEADLAPSVTNSSDD